MDRKTGGSEFSSKIHHPRSSCVTLVQSNNICSVWLPLIDVVDNAPMAFCDRRSTKDDFVVIDRVLTDGPEEILYLHHRPAHCWHWLQGKIKDEPVLFINWDSYESELATGILQLHLAFMHRSSSPDFGPHRSSHTTRIIPKSKSFKYVRVLRFALQL